MSQRVNVLNLMDVEMGPAFPKDVPFLKPMLCRDKCKCTLVVILKTHGGGYVAVRESGLAGGGSGSEQFMRDNYDFVRYLHKDESVLIGGQD